MGKTIQIKHDNGYVSVYQSLSEVTIKKGDSINQGQTIGKSGSNELDKEIEFAKGCGLPQFVMGLQQAKKIIGEIDDKLEKEANKNY